MLLASELIEYIARQMVRKLTPLWMETSQPESAATYIANVVDDDLAIEDQLNDEVREMLSQYSEYMRKEGVSYQDMFRKHQEHPDHRSAR